jgi:hypothetical protein
MIYTIKGNGILLFGREGISNVDWTQNQFVFYIS